MRTKAKFADAKYLKDQDDRELLRLIVEIAAISDYYYCDNNTLTLEGLDKKMQSARKREDWHTVHVIQTEIKYRRKQRKD